jgi:hypothetical protein
MAAAAGRGEDLDEVRLLGPRQPDPGAGVTLVSTQPERRVCQRSHRVRISRSKSLGRLEARDIAEVGLQRRVPQQADILAGQPRHRGPERSSGGPDSVPTSAARVTSPEYPKLVRSPGDVNTSGAGHCSGPRATPSGADHMTSVARPESPGLTQYTCHPGSIVSWTPTRRPLEASATSLAETGWASSAHADTTAHSATVEIKTRFTPNTRRGGAALIPRAARARTPVGCPRVRPRTGSRVHSSRPPPPIR